LNRTLIHRFRGTVVIIALVLLLASPAAALEGPEEEREPWHVTAANYSANAFDVVLLRPLGFAATVGGFACFTVALPFSAIAQDIGTSWDIFVLGPADYTFTRPIGDF